MGAKPDPSRQRRLAELVAGGAKIEEASLAVGISVRQARRWLALPEWQAVVGASRAQAADPTALRALQDALLAERRPGVPDHPTRVRAAEILARMNLGPAEPEAVPAGAVVVYPGALTP